MRILGKGRIRRLEYGISYLLFNILFLPINITPENQLSEELAILRPEVCLFLTGPNYDDDIRHKLCDVQFEEFKDFDIRKVAKLKSSFLPSKSYRTYHPGYGNRKKSIYELILTAIIDDIGK